MIGGGTKVGQIFYEVALDTGRMVSDSRKVGDATERMASRFSAVTVAVKVFAAALALVKASQVADDMRLLAARIQVAAGSVDKAAAAMSALVDISNRTQTSVAANAQVFQRLNQSLLQMGGTQQDTLQLTELLGKAIKVSGASAQESSAAMLQFGQALGSGKLAGDELRSLMETAPYLMRQLADGIGVPVGALKQLGEEGKLTADVVVNAMQKAAEQIDADFSKIPRTLSGAMQVAQDAAARLVAELDNVAQSSEAMTGAATGVGEVLDRLARQFAEANGQAGDFSRNQGVRDWANATRLALSYVVDAVDVTWQALSVFGRNVAYVFKGVGNEIGGIAAQVAAVARGDFSGAAEIGRAMKADADRRRAELDASDAKTLANRRLFGQQMRETWEQAAKEDRGFTPRMPGSNIKPPKATEPAGKKRGGGSQFDAEGYLAGLQKQTLEGVELVNMIEQEALRKNAELLAEKKITAEQSARAITLIELNAVNERRDIALRAAEESRAMIERQGAEEAAAAQRAAAERARAQEFAIGVLASGDPVEVLRLELEQKSAMLVEFAERDQENAALYAAARVSLEHQTAEAIKRIQDDLRNENFNKMSQALQSYGAIFGNLTDITRTFAGEQSSTFRAMFAISKAFAIADAVIKIQQGIANAMSLPFPLNIGAAASVASAAAGIVSTIQGTSFGGGRQYGGPTAAGTLYRVNEGGRPEMFTAANGSQYMLPTTDGRVTSAGDLARGSRSGGGTTMNVTQSFTFSGPVDRRTQQEVAAAAQRGLQQAGTRYN